MLGDGLGVAPVPNYVITSPLAVAATQVFVFVPIVALM